MFCQCDASKPSHRLCLAHRLTVFNCFFHLLCDEEIAILMAKYLPDFTINYPHCVRAFLLNRYFCKEREQHCKSITSIVSKQIHFLENKRKREPNRTIGARGDEEQIFKKHILALGWLIAFQIDPFI